LLGGMGIEIGVEIEGRDRDRVRPEVIWRGGGGGSVTSSNAMQRCATATTRCHGAGMAANLT
jgi:hypothetical protein